MTPTTIVTAASISAPSSMTREMDVFVGRFHNRLEDSPASSGRRLLPASSAPNVEQRGWLERRREVLRQSLATPAIDQVKESVLLLFGGSAQYGASKDEMRMKAALYAETIIKAAIPIWALEAARDAFGRPGWRSLWDGKGVPGRADVVAECRFILLPVETELRRIEAVLDAEVYDTGATEDDRADAIAHWHATRAGMRGESAITERTEEEISAERASMARANDRFRERARVEAEGQGRGQAMWGRLPISDELARQIGLRVPMPESHEEDVH